MAVNDNDCRVIRTKALIQKGLTQLAKQKSINKITVKELTDLIGINRGTFYLHYQDIYSLVESVKREIFESFNEMMSNVTSNMAIKDPVEILEQFCIFIKNNSQVIVMLLGKNGDAAFADGLGTIINDKCFTVISEIFPNADTQIYDHAYNYCKYGTVGLIGCWLKDYPDWEPRKVAEFWAKLIAHGIYGIVDTE